MRGCELLTSLLRRPPHNPCPCIPGAGGLQCVSMNWLRFLLRNWLGMPPISNGDPSRKMTITIEEFRKMTEFLPEQDDLERANCHLAGNIGHSSCGVCLEHNKPRFICGCLVHQQMMKVNNQGSCDGSRCAPRYEGEWKQKFAWLPVRANKGWAWFVWLHFRIVLLGGHGHVRKIPEYRHSM